MGDPVDRKEAASLGLVRPESIFLNRDKVSLEKTTLKFGTFVTVTDPAPLESVVQCPTLDLI